MTIDAPAAPSRRGRPEGIHPTSLRSKLLSIGVGEEIYIPQNDLNTIAHAVCACISKDGVLRTRKFTTGVCDVIDADHQHSVVLRIRRIL